MRMKAKTTGCITVVATLALLGSPISHADDASFVRTVESLGFEHEATNFVSTAQSACYFLQRGRDPRQVEERIRRYELVEPPLAHQFLVLAVNEYCPQYTGAVGA